MRARYVLRRGFDLPPLMLTEDEAEAVATGLRLLRRIRDPKLHAAAERVLGKLAAVVPDGLRTHLAAPALYVTLRLKAHRSRRLRCDWIHVRG